MKKFLKWFSIIVLSVVVLFLLLIGVVVWILTPEKLTPLVEKYGSEFINGEIKVERVELTYWKTFPHLYVDIDKLVIISHSLDSISPEERAKLPANADTLLSVNKFHGGVHLLDLLRKRVTLMDLMIDHPAANIAEVRPGVSNYNIFPKTEPDTTATEIPDIAINKFEIVGDMPIRYVSLADSIDASLTLSRTSLGGEKSPSYTIALAGDASTSIGIIALKNIRLGMGGDVVWRKDEPYKVEVKDFEAGVNNILVTTNAKVDFDKDLTVESMDFKLKQVAVNEFLALVPQSMRQGLKGITTNLEVALQGKLTKAYVPSKNPLPSMSLKMDIPKGKIRYQQFNLEAFNTNIEANIDGDKLDRSTVDIKKRYASGEGISLTLKAKASTLLSDPHVKGTVTGGVNIDRLPKALLQMTGMQVSGRMTADTEFDVRQSQLSR